MNEPAVTITTSWDDGHPLDLRLADLLSKYNVPATFYVPLDSERGVLSNAQVRELGSRFEIGAHTVHHRPVTHLPLNEARREILDSKPAIEDITGKECRAFCFPWGKYQRTHLRLVGEAGFACARTVQMLSLDRPSSKSGIQVMPTTVQAFSHPAAALLRNIAKRAALGSAVRWLLDCRRFDWVEIARSHLERAMLEGGVFHLWGHSWEIEEHRQWGRVEEIFRTIAQFRDPVRFCTNSQVLAVHAAAANSHRP